MLTRHPLFLFVSAKSTKKPTVREKAIKEIKRLEKAARRVEKRGYTFELPFNKEKKRYTRKELEQLQKLKTKDLYKYARYGELSGEERRQQERREAAQKAAETKRAKQEAPTPLSDNFTSSSQYIIDNFLDRSSWIYMSDNEYERLVDWTNNKISSYGYDITAYCIEMATNDRTVQDIKRDYKTNITTRLYLLEEYFDEYNYAEDRYYEGQEEIGESFQSIPQGLELPFNFDNNLDISSDSAIIGTSSSRDEGESFNRYFGG